MSSKNKNVEGKIRSLSLDSFEVIDQESTVSKKGASGGASKKRIIRGIANKNTVDRANERVEPSAFISSKDAFLTNAQMFFNHDWSTPVGKFTSLEIKEDGLHVEGEVASGYEEAEKVWSMVKQSLVSRFSIGFIPKVVEYDRDTETEIIKDLELLEISIVTVPENADSTFEVSEKGMVEGILAKNSSNDWVTYKALIEPNEPTEESEVEEDKDVNKVKSCISIPEESACIECKESSDLLEYAIHPTGKIDFICYPCLGQKHFAHLSKQVEVEQESTEEATEEVTEEVKPDKSEELAAANQELEEKLSEVSAELESAQSTLSEREAQLEHVMAERMADLLRQSADIIREATSDD